MKVFVIVLVIVLILIWCVVFANKDRLNNYVNTNYKYELIYGSINKMNYDELDKIHNELLPLCNEVVFSEIAFSMNNKGSDLQYNDKRNEALPNDKRIYGCKTYGDAFELNTVIVKRLDALDERDK